jgi:hypothetical protein
MAAPEYAADLAMLALDMLDDEDWVQVIRVRVN